MLLSSLLLHIHRKKKYDIYTVESDMDSLHTTATTRRVQRSSPSGERSAAECHRSAPMVVSEPAGAGRSGEKKPLIMGDSPVFCKEHDETKELHTLFQTITRIESHDFDSCHDQTMSLIK